MRKDTTFSDRKLTREEFSQKYWLDGKVPYQYHTAEIEDGRDEREQFIINNCRALYELIRDLSRHNRRGDMVVEVKELERRMDMIEVQLRAIESALTASREDQPISQSSPGK